MAEWMPIASAPRDGTKVLIWLGGIKSEARVMMASAKAPDPVMGSGLTGWAYPTGSTHWMPLPAPPETKE